eukprot:scpid38977/ scgid29821/ 
MPAELRLRVTYPGQPLVLSTERESLVPRSGSLRPVAATGWLSSDLLRTDSTATAERLRWRLVVVLLLRNSPVRLMRCGCECGSRSSSVSSELERSTSAMIQANELPSPGQTTWQSGQSKARFGAKIESSSSVLQTAFQTAAVIILSPFSGTY